MKSSIFISIYSLTLFLFVVFSYVFVDPNLFYLSFLYTGFFSNYRSISATIFIIFIFLFFLFYGLIALQLYRKKIQTRVVLILIGATMGIAFFSYPAMLSHDIFNYLTTAKVLFFYQENPYTVMPIEFVGEPYLAFTRAANKLALYGPLWILLSGIPFSLGFGNFIFTLYSFKILTLVFYMLTGVLLYKLTKSLFPVALFLLNPLVVIEVIVSAHNDIIMMFFVLLSYYLLQNKKTFWAVIAFAISVGIKYVTFALLPIFLYAIVKTCKKEKINWNKIFILSGWTMFGVFLLSPLREEFYPWYVIWFFLFAVLFQKKNILYTISLVLTFGTLLRYAPVIHTGSYGGITPIVKEIVTFIPLLAVLLFLTLRKYIRLYV